MGKPPVFLVKKGEGGSWLTAAQALREEKEKALIWEIDQGFWTWR